VSADLDATSERKKASIVFRDDFLLPTCVTLVVGGSSGKQLLNSFPTKLLSWLITREYFSHKLLASIIALRTLVSISIAANIVAVSHLGFQAILSRFNGLD
jgi:hypothetical protein